MSAETGRLAPYRVGSVQYLNAAPLTYGLENEILFTTPARLAGLLQQDELEAGLVSIVEALYHDRYDILDGIAIASCGEVKSVFLAHRRPVAELAEIYCDPASLTSVKLLQVVLAERGWRPQLKPLPAYAAAAELDGVLLIGNAALDFLRAPHAHTLMDLGTEWRNLTGLPFVYAIWALRRSRENAPLRRLLTEARDRGQAGLETIIRERPEYDYNLRQDYLRRCIRYDMGPEEKQGVARFIELLRRHGLGPVHEPRYVG